MSIEKHSIEFKKFRNPDGKPTCAIRANPCQFLRAKKFGVLEVCIFDDQVILDRDGKAGLGWLVPHENCPFWKDEK